MAHESPDLKNTEYLGVLILPKKADLQSISRQIASLTELDAKNIQNRLLGGVPAIIGSVKPSQAKAAIQWMVSQGIEAAVTHDGNLKKRGKPSIIKNLQVMEGRLEIECLRDPAFSVPFSSVRSIVHGNLGLRKPQTKSDRSSHIENQAWEFPLATPIIGQVISRQNIHSARAKSNASKSLRQIIDLHCLENGKWKLLRIDGDKQGWRHLGDAKGYSDLANSKKTLELFSVILSTATCDECYREFVVPKEARHQIYKDIPRDLRFFDFYSRWISCMHTTLRGH